MSDTNSTTHDSQGQTLLSLLGSMLMQGIHVFLTLLQTSHVAVVALLIDGENMSPDLTAQVLVEAGKFGGVTIRRVYGNVTSPNMQTAVSKNAADIALVVDAMELFYRDHVTRFCLVASDSDYTPLVLRLCSAGCIVIGIGEPKTPSALVKACTVFVSTDQLTQPSKRAKSAPVSIAKVAPTAPLPTTRQKSSPPTTLPTKPDAQLPELLSRAYKEATKGKEGAWVLISQLGVALRKIDPSFKTTVYGQKDLSSLLRKQEDLYEIHKRDDKGGHLEVRLRKQAH
jgi:uncharacterized LabA/DUF88 family protein